MPDQGSVALFSEPTVARRMRLKTQHNQQAPISRLPEETLYKVFLCIANARLDHGQRVYDHWWKQWRNGTQICTQWRFVGLGSPRLWSIIIATKERKEVEFYLRHSKNCPLTVEIAPFSAEEKSIVSSILQHLPRIQDLSFWRCDDHLDVLLPLLAAGCPLLERVDLVSHNHVSLGPLITFGQQTPALKQLQLHFIYPSWETAQIRGLTDLTIGFSAGSYRPTLECFFELLRECPDLEHLTLELDQRLVRSSPASGPSVPLRRLCWVHFFAPSIACAEFLDGLILSNKITMDMRSTLRLSEGPIRIFPRHFLPSASISDNIALHLHLHGCAEPHFYDITIKFISASSGTNITHLYEGIYLRGKTSMDAFMKVGLTLTDIHLMECISSLKIKCSSGLKGAVESETWRRFLIRMPQLKNLETSAHIFSSYFGTRDQWNP
ncbi:hypothetical protein BD410DRAFT_140398 [Rickenella mellea]|uniref:F-box domain-containing protein n=1 Tax=Rickenella mellea TaxID=50990 RepID=A0A4Y7PIW2_9AGAM|nr:hypothetical protein BD410DRAFT_140398 [Rickenella mellea]